MRRIRLVNVVLLVLALLMAAVVPGLAQSTTKDLSTNFTLVNLGTEAVTDGEVRYYTDTTLGGGEWRTYQTFDLDPNGGQAIFRQYTDLDLPEGRGSVVVSAGQPIGAVVQIRALNDNPTSSGAYSGFPDGDAKFYLPLVARQLATGSGLANSQIVIQNTGLADVDVEVLLLGTLASSGSPHSYTKPIVGIKPSASYLYDLALEDPANVPDTWYGSAVVTAKTAGGKIAVVTNFFTGDAMQTFNGFPSLAPDTQWFVPLFTSKLANSLSTPVAVQNLSGGEIPIDGITLTCTPDQTMPPGTPGITRKNAGLVGDGAAIYFSPPSDAAMPSGWYGSCIVTSSADVVVFVQMRYVTGNEAAAYEAIPGSSTDKKVVVPLIAKRLANGFATAVTIQNLNTTASANVTLTYTPSKDYPGSQTPIVVTDQTIGPGASLIQNQRITSFTTLPDGWFGTLVVEDNANDPTPAQPLGAFVQLTYLRDINPSLPSGDNFMAHVAFTQP